MNQAPPAPYLSTENIVRAVLRHWKLVALTGLAVMLLAWLMAALQPKLYRANAIAAVEPVVEQLQATDVLRSVDTLERRVVVASVAALASTPETTRQVLGSLRGSYELDAVVLPNTNLFNITVNGPDPKQVAAIANRVPAALSPQTRAMYRLYRVSLVSAAVPPSRAALPRVERAVIAGLLLGLLLGVAIAWLLDQRTAAS